MNTFLLEKLGTVLTVRVIPSDSNTIHNILSNIVIIIITIIIMIHFIYIWMT